MGYMSIPGNLARSNLVFAIWEYDKDEKRGRTLFRCGHLVLPGILLEPDGSFTLRSRNPKVGNRYVPVAPDIAIEVVQLDRPTDTMYLKAPLYLRGGTSIFWVIQPDSKCLIEYRPNQAPRKLSIDDTIDSGDVLPGFKLAVRDVFV